MMQTWFQKYRHALWFLLFGVLSAFYFVSQHLGLRYHIVHLPLDDRLPFWPAFIVFYILWYFYVPGCMLWACFRVKDVFYQQVAALFSGAFVCAAVFVLYPTCVDFRPSAAGPGLARALCRLIYANDAPVNVFPSLHCYEALVMHLATFRVPPLRAQSAASGIRRAGRFDLSVHSAGQTALHGRSDRRMHAGCGDVSADGPYFRQKEGTP